MTLSTKKSAVTIIYDSGLSIEWGVTEIEPALLVGRANEVTTLNDDCCYLVFHK